MFILATGNEITILVKIFVPMENKGKNDRAKKEDAATDKDIYNIFIPNVDVESGKLIYKYAMNLMMKAAERENNFELYQPYVDDIKKKLELLKQKSEDEN